MEVVRRETGLEVRFDGSSIPCYNDTDCPGSGLCAINQTWFSDELRRKSDGWCMCNTNMGLGGLKCNELCANGEMIIAMLSINIASASIGLGVVLYYGIPYVRVHGICDRKHQAIVVTWLFCTLGLLFYLIFNILYYVASIGFRDYSSIYWIENREVLQSPQVLITAQFVFRSLASCLGNAAEFVLPLVWIQILNRVFHLRKGIVFAVHVWSCVLVTVLLAVTAPLLILASLAYRSRIDYWAKIALPIWMTILGSIALLNFVAFIKVTRLIQERKRRMIQQPQQEQMKKRNNDQVSIKMDWILRRIQLTALGLMTTILIRFVVVFFNGALAGRTNVSDPRCDVDWNNFAGRMLATTVAMLSICLCFWFIRPNLMGAISLENGEQRGNNGNTEDSLRRNGIVSSSVGPAPVETIPPFASVTIV